MSAETNKRYTLIYPEDEHEKVQSVADQYGTSAALEIAAISLFPFQIGGL
jgi:hypothetical protein